MRYIINTVFTFFRLWKAYMRDFVFCLKYSLSIPNYHETDDKRLARIMLLMHALEKGMSFKESTRTFGGEKAKALSKRLNDYLTTHPINNTCIVALNVLHEYLTNPNSTQDKAIRTSITLLLDAHKEVVKDGYAGTKNVSEPPTFNKAAIETFFSSRSSIRDYSDEPVSDEEIASALHIASFTPSACNRQTSRVHVYRDKQKMKDIINNQLGNQNWCDNATVLFLITAKESYFGGEYERHQALIDGGLYAMNFVHGLHLNHIASCFKMFVRGVSIERQFRKVTGITADEIPIVLVLAGHYKPGAVCCPKSVRLKEAIS